MFRESLATLNFPRRGANYASKMNTHLIDARDRDLATG